MTQDSQGQEFADKSGENTVKTAPLSGHNLADSATAPLSAQAETGGAVQAEAAVPADQDGAINRNPHLKWYAVMTQSNMEKRVKTVLEERVKKKKLDQYFGRIIIPTMTSEVFDEKGKKKKVEVKMMPGYIFVEMELVDPAYHLVKDTPKVGNFLGATMGRTPPPLSDEEIDRILNRAAFVAKEEAAKPKATFEKGEKVKVIDGPFTNFVGEVDEVKNEKQKLRLLISVFGRPTPVEIEFSKVERIDPNAQPEA